MKLWTLLSLFAAVAVGSGLGLASPAHAWDPFRVENSHVAHGNEALRAHDADGALHEYEAAARELPAEPGVHLDRGLALLAKGVFDRAREALLVATEPPAPAPIRADAYYDMGLAFYRQGDAAAEQAAQQATQGGASPLQGAPGTGPGQGPGQGAGAGPGQGQPPHADHHEATRLFRESADSYRRSLRARPGNRDAAWNLELALRRIHEEEEAQRQQDEQERQEREQQQQQQQGQQGQQGDQGQQQQQQQGDSQSGDQGQHQQQQQDQGQQGQQQDPQGQQGSDPSQDPNGAQGQQQQQQEAHSVGGDDSAAETDAQQSQHPSADGLPANVARVLDALPDSTVERARARAQAMRENRQPTQDW